MKFQTRKVCVLISAIVMALVHFSPVSQGFAEVSDTGPAPIATGTYHGQVLEVEEHTLVVKQADGEIVRVRLPGQSGYQASDFQVGDQVEATVSPQGVTTSVKQDLPPR